MSTVDSALVAQTLATAQRQNRAAGQAATSWPVAPEIHIGLSYEPGTRVLDLVTGQEGVTIAGTITHSLVQRAGPAGG